MSLTSVHEPECRHYGGEHHRLSVIDQLGTRVEHHVHEMSPFSSAWDPRFLRRITPALDASLAYYDAEIEGFERVPDGDPVLVVGNHSGGIFMPDYWAFLRRWIRERGVERPLHALGFDFMFALPGVESIARRLGTVPASFENAHRVLGDGRSLLVYPGGDAASYRPWTERHRVDLHGRTGFVRLALQHRVPVVPMVGHGSHDVIVVLTRGEAIAKGLGLNRLRIKVLPLLAGPPWGIAPIYLPTLPLPAKLTVRVCEPLDWRSLPPEAADDPVIVHRCYEETLGRMQAALDELIEAAPHPLIERIRDPGRRRSAARGSRP